MPRNKGRRSQRQKEKKRGSQRREPNAPGALSPELLAFLARLQQALESGQAIALSPCSGPEFIVTAADPVVPETRRTREAKDRAGEGPPTLEQELRTFRPVLVIFAVAVIALIGYHIVRMTGISGWVRDHQLLDWIGGPPLEHLVLFGVPIASFVRWLYFRITEKAVGLTTIGTTVVVSLALGADNVPSAPATPSPEVVAQMPNYPIPGDASRTEHLTHDPDRDTVHAGERYVKRVLIVNESDTVTWRERQLCRLGPHQVPRGISSPECMLIPSLAPKQGTTIDIPLRAGTETGYQSARFKILDKNRREYFPGGFPLRADTYVRS